MFGRVQSDALALNIAAICTVAAYAVHSVTDFNLHIPANALLVAFAFGILANPGVTPQPAAPQSMRAGTFPRLALAALGLWMAAFGLPTLRGEYYAEKSRTALRDEKYADSIDFARKGIDAEKKNPYLYLQLGQAQSEIADSTTDPRMRKQLLAGALDAFQRGLILFPQEKWMLLGAGAAMEGLGRPLEAEPFYQRAVEWDPNSAETRYLYGSFLQRAGKIAGAAQQYSKSLEILVTDAAADALKKLNAPPAAIKKQDGPQPGR
jgi:tetratricopeptide (TPR) repeat protein